VNTKTLAFELVDPITEVKHGCIRLRFICPDNQWRHADVPRELDPYVDINGKLCLAAVGIGAQKRTSKR
jgi:hypothetical protein